MRPKALHCMCPRSRTRALLEAQREFQRGREACVGAAEGLGACLTKMYEARKEQLAAAPAVLASPTVVESPTPTPSYQAAPAPVAAQTIEQPDWLRRPSGDDLQAHYPPRARQQNMAVGWCWLVP
jgi:hypothetical protein